MKTEMLVMKMKMVMTMVKELPHLVPHREWKVATVSMMVLDPSRMPPMACMVSVSCDDATALLHVPQK